MILFLLRMFGMISNIITGLFESCVRFWGSLEEAFSPREYIFFDFNPAPYLYRSVKERATVSATPQWLYDRDTKMFTQYDIENSGKGGTMSKLPILSLEIIYKDKVEYDLTDFIDYIRVRSIGSDTKAGPSIPHILGAWSLKSGIVLDSIRGFEIRLIDDMANTIEMPPYDYSDIYDILAGVMEGAATAGEGSGDAAHETGVGNEGAGDTPVTGNSEESHQLINAEDVTA